MANFTLKIAPEFLPRQVNTKTNKLKYSGMRYLAVVFAILRR